RPQEDVPGDGALLPGGGLAAGLQQRDPAVLDEAERAGLGAAVVAGGAVGGRVDGVKRSGRRRPPPGPCGAAARSEPVPWELVSSLVLRDVTPELICIDVCQYRRFWVSGH